MRGSLSEVRRSLGDSIRSFEMTPVQAGSALGLGATLGVVATLLVVPLGVSANDDAGMRSLIAQDARGRAVLRQQPAAPRYTRTIADPIDYYFRPIVQSFSPHAWRRPKQPPAVAYSYAPRGGEAIRIMDQSGASHRGAAPAAKKPQATFRDASDKSEKARPAVVQQTRRFECVRLCDGYHFPVGGLSPSASWQAQESMCQAACPDADVKLFSMGPGGAIEGAVSRDMRRYASLPAAFAYRTSRTASCTCNRSKTPTRLSILIDPTLRPGDAVVTETGAKVFNGSDSWPRRPSDFTDFAVSAKLNKADRKKVDALVGVTYAQNLLKPYAVARQNRNEQVAQVQIIRPTQPQTQARQPEPRYIQQVRQVESAAPAAAPAQRRNGIVTLSAPPHILRVVESRSAPGFQLR